MNGLCSPLTIPISRRWSILIFSYSCLCSNDTREDIMIKESLKVETKPSPSRDLRLAIRRARGKRSHTNKTTLVTHE